MPSPKFKQPDSTLHTLYKAKTEEMKAHRKKFDKNGLKISTFFNHHSYQDTLCKTEAEYQRAYDAFQLQVKNNNFTPLEQEKAFQALLPHIMMLKSVIDEVNTSQKRDQLGQTEVNRLSGIYFNKIGLAYFTNNNLIAAESYLKKALAKGCYYAAFNLTQVAKKTRDKKLLEVAILELLSTALQNSSYTNEFGILDLVKAQLNFLLEIYLLKKRLDQIELLYQNYAAFFGIRSLAKILKHYGDDDYSNNAIWLARCIVHLKQEDPVDLDKLIQVMGNQIDCYLATDDHANTFKWLVEYESYMGEAVLAGCAETFFKTQGVFSANNLIKAHGWLFTAAHTGDEVSCRRYLNSYLCYPNNKTYFPYDEVISILKAIMLNATHSDALHAEAHYISATLQEDGLDFTQAHTSCFQHYLIAASLNHTLAIYKVADFYLYGIGTDKNIAMARNLYEQAFKANLIDAGISLAALLLKIPKTTKGLDACVQEGFDVLNHTEIILEQNFKTCENPVVLLSQNATPITRAQISMLRAHYSLVQLLLSLDPHTIFTQSEPSDSAWLIDNIDEKKLAIIQKLRYAKITKKIDVVAVKSLQKLLAFKTLTYKNVIHELETALPALVEDKKNQHNTLKTLGIMYITEAKNALELTKAVQYFEQWKDLFYKKCNEEFANLLSRFALYFKAESKKDNAQKWKVDFLQKEAFKYYKQAICYIDNISPHIRVELENLFTPQAVVGQKSINNNLMPKKYMSGSISGNDLINKLRYKLSDTASHISPIDIAALTSYLLELGEHILLAQPLFSRLTDAVTSISQNSDLTNVSEIISIISNVGKWHLLDASAALKPLFVKLFNNCLDLSQWSEALKSLASSGMSVSVLESELVPILHAQLLPHFDKLIAQKIPSLLELSNLFYALALLDSSNNHPNPIYQNLAIKILKCINNTVKSASLDFYHASEIYHADRYFCLKYPNADWKKHDNLEHSLERYNDLLKNTASTYPSNAQHAIFIALKRTDPNFNQEIFIETAGRVVDFRHAQKKSWVVQYHGSYHHWRFNKEGVALASVFKDRLCEKTLQLAGYTVITISREKWAQVQGNTILEDQLIQKKLGKLVFHSPLGHVNTHSMFSGTKTRPSLSQPSQPLHSFVVR